MRRLWYVLLVVLAIVLLGLIWQGGAGEVPIMLIVALAIAAIYWFGLRGRATQG